MTIGGRGQDLLLRIDAPESESRGDVVNSTSSPAFQVVPAAYQRIAWTGDNPVEVNDVTGDGTVSPQDALVIINHLRAHGPRSLTWGPRLPNGWASHRPPLDAASLMTYAKSQFENREVR